MDIIDKVKDKVEDKDVQIELLEELADSTTPKEEMISKAEYDKLLVELDLYKKKYEELQDKYISRFGETSENISEKEVELPKEEIEEEKEVVDVKDIFEEKEEEE